MLTPEPEEFDHVLSESLNNARLFHTALQNLRETPDFLDVSYQSAFNWKQIISTLPPDFKSTFYVVAFRSTITPDLSPEKIDLLYESDAAAHSEALESGGLLKYWYASPDPSGRNLATCLWHAREDAVRAAKLPWHRKAAELIRQGMYETWTLERYSLEISDVRFQFLSL